MVSFYCTEYSDKSEVSAERVSSYMGVPNTQTARTRKGYWCEIQYCKHCRKDEKSTAIP